MMNSPRVRVLSFVLLIFSGFSADTRAAQAPDPADAVSVDSLQIDPARLRERSELVLRHDADAGYRQIELRVEAKERALIFHKTAIRLYEPSSGRQVRRETVLRAECDKRAGLPLKQRTRRRSYRRGSDPPSRWRQSLRVASDVAVIRTENNNGTFTRRIAWRDSAVPQAAVPWVVSLLPQQPDAVYRIDRVLSDYNTEPPKPLLIECAGERTLRVGVRDVECTRYRLWRPRGNGAKLLSELFIGPEGKLRRITGHHDDGTDVYRPVER